MNIGVHISFKDLCFHFMDKFPEVELLDNLVVLFFPFGWTSILFSILSALIYIFISNEWGFPFLHTFANTYLPILFDSSHSNRCEVILWFLFSFPWWLIMITSSLVAFGHMYVFGKMSVQIFCAFLIGLSVYLFTSGWINPLSNILFVNVFSHSVNCCFVWFFCCIAWCGPTCFLLFRSKIKKIIAKTDIKELISYVFF